jgi:hypothetical protein
MTSMQELKSRAQKLPPVDDTVKLPAAIRAAAARADAVHQQAYETPKEPDAPVTQPPAEQPKQDGTEGQPEATQPEATAQPEAGTENPPATPKDGGDWEHKYNSMKGRYDRAEEMIRGLNSRISQLEGLLARAAEQKPTAPNPDLTFKPLITDKDKEDFGAEFIDVAQRAAQEKLSPEIKQLRQELERLQGQLGSVAQRSQVNTQQSMVATLDRDLPDWRKINKDQKFIAWVNLPDPLSGAIRINMLREAYDNGEAERVLRFFKGFLQDEAATAPAEVAQPAVTPPGNTKVPLENFAAPGRATSPAATVTPGEKESITHAQIAQFYLDVQKGKYKGNEAQKVKIEEMIFAAQAEGRII